MYSTHWYDSLGRWGGDGVPSLFSNTSTFLHLEYFFNPGFSDISVITIISVWRERLHCVMLSVMCVQHLLNGIWTCITASVLTHCSTVHCPQKGHTALHAAAGEGHSEIVKLLLIAGAATDIRNKV